MVEEWIVGSTLGLIEACTIVVAGRCIGVGDCIGAESVARGRTVGFGCSSVGFGCSSVGRMTLVLRKITL